jgi:hypothetical protein
MFEKQGKFYADWRDRAGRRLRKSFTTARAALRYEEEQKSLANPKPKAQGRPSPKFSAPVSRAGAVRRRTTAKLQKPSPPRPAHAASANSARRTSSTSPRSGSVATSTSRA